MKPTLLAAAALAGSLAPLHAQSFFTTPTPIFRTPAWRGTGVTEFSHWDVFYSPYNGINYPDFDAPNGEGSFASDVGATVPANANPGDPYAFWDAANPTVKQVLEPGAFIIGPGTAGNIYSPFATTAYELADATPFTAGTVVLQWQTDGTLIDFDTLRLVTSGGAQIAPANFITEYKSSGSSFGGTTNRTAAQWNLTGLGVKGYTIKFTASGSSTSLQEVLLDTAPTYTEAVASARTWNATTGNWSAGANWSGGTVGPVGGNIVIASGSGVTIDGGVREIGELKLNAAASFTISATGGGLLKVNAGLTANAGSHTISAPLLLGSFNLDEIAAGTTVTLAGPVSGTSGLVKFGDGTLRLTANNSNTGTITLDGGTLEISGTNAFTGSPSVISGRLILKSNATNALGSGGGAVKLGTGGTSGAAEAAVIVDGGFSFGRAFTVLNGNDPKKIGGQNTGAGVVYSGAITLQSTAGALSLHAQNAGDTVTFSGAISGGNLTQTVTKTGAGRVIFSGAGKSYISDTVVSAGILEVAAGTSLTGTREVSVSSGGKLALHTSVGNLSALNIGDGGVVELSAGSSPFFNEVPEPSVGALALFGALLFWKRRARVPGSTLALVFTLFAATAFAELPPLPQPATSFGAALADGWLYVYGGNTGKAHEFNRDCVKGDFFRLKLPDGTAWEKLPGGTALLSVSLVAHDGKIIRVGGMNARNATAEKNDLHSTAEVMRFDPATQKWDALPPLPEPRSSHDSVVVGDTLYAGGGWRLAGGDGEGAGAAWEKTLLTLDLKSPDQGWQKIAQPFARRAIATVADGKRLWFLGGMDSKDEPSRAVDWFEPATGVWGKAADLADGPMAGFGIAGCAAGGRVLASPLSGKISALSADGKAWEEIATLSPARFFHRLLPMTDGRLIAVGGSNKQGQVRTLEIISLNQTPTASLP